MTFNENEIPDSDIYIQCKLVRSVGTECHVMTTYLSKKHAELDNVLKLRNEFGKWIDGWIVFGVFTHKRIGVPDIRKSVRAHRKRTGDSLPK